MGADWRVWEHVIPEGVDLEPMDRLVGRTGAVLISSDVSTIDIRVFLEGSRDTLYQLLGITPGNGSSGPIFDTLQLDGRWRPGTPGYNSRHLVTAAALAAYTTPLVLRSGSDYRLEIITHTSAWGIVPSVHLYKVRELRSLSP